MKEQFVYILTVLILLALGAGLLMWKSVKNTAQQQAQNQEQQKNEQKKDTFTQSDLDKIFGLNRKEIGTKIYYSEKLGVGFTYISNPNSNFPINIVESDNKINVLDQTIEVFTKDPKLSLEEAIKNRFLQGYNPADCFVKTYETNEQRPSSYTSAGISFPLTTNNSDPFWVQNSKCPRGYSETNGVRYFLMNKNVPEKFLFVSIGQALAVSDGTPRTSDEGFGFNWDHSIQILK